MSFEYQSKKFIASYLCYNDGSSIKNYVENFEVMRSCIKLSQRIKVLMLFDHFTRSDSICYLEKTLVDIKESRKLKDRDTKGRVKKYLLTESFMKDLKPEIFKKSSKISSNQRQIFSFWGFRKSYIRKLVTNEKNIARNKGNIKRIPR